MGHYAQVVLALIISTALSLIAWGWARRSQTRQAAAPQLAGSYQNAPGDTAESARALSLSPVPSWH
jgi:hypothetical protein